MLIYHFRYRKIKGRHIVGVVVFVGLVTFVALLRRAGVGIAEIELSPIEHLLASGRIGLLHWLIYTVMIFEGQPALSHVIGIVDDVTGPYYGLTYVNTVLMRLVPFEVPGLDFMPQPRLWYRTVRGFVFGSPGHGFSILAEAYMNFGRYGFVVFVFVCLLARWLSFTVYTARHPVMLLWAAFALVVLILALRGDSLPLFMRAVWYIVPLTVFHWAMLFVRLLAQPIAPGRSPAGRVPELA